MNQNGISKFLFFTDVFEYIIAIQWSIHNGNAAVFADWTYVVELLYSLAVDTNQKNAAKSINEDKADIRKWSTTMSGGPPTAVSVHTNEITSFGLSSSMNAQPHNCSIRSPPHCLLGWWLLFVVFIMIMWNIFPIQNLYNHLSEGRQICLSTGLFWLV